MTIQMWDLNVW